MKDLSVVIVNHNAKEYLDKCLESVARTASDISHEVILVDNSSSDGSIALVEKKYPHVKILRNEENLGFGKANNKGIQGASGKYIMLLNNDVMVKDKALEMLVGFLDKAGDAGAVGPKLLNANGTIQYQCRRGFPTPLNALFYFSGFSRLFPGSRKANSYLKTYLDDRVTEEVDSLCGASMVIRREVLEKAGLLDEDYFMYGEDIDLCYRIKNAGWKVFYLPDAEIVHYGGRTSRLYARRNIYEFHRAMYLFYKKHYAKKHIFIVNWIVYAGIWMKYLLDMAKNFFRRDKFVGAKKPEAAHDLLGERLN